MTVGNVAEIADRSGAAAPAIHLSLLGGFSARLASGRAPAFPTQKSRLLLAFLAMPAGQAHQRSKLAALLWPDRLEEQARASLRNALSALRALLGADAIEAAHETVRLAPGVVDSDVARLEAAAERSDETMTLADIRPFARPLLDGVDLTGTDLEEWLSFERTRCLGRAERLLHGLAERLRAERKEAEAVEAATALLALDPLRERSHRLLMKIYADQGDRSRALAQFRRCRDLLASELSVEPSPETAALARSIAQASGGEATVVPFRPAPAVRRATGYNLSIAVLPFSSMSDDPDQRFLADGMCEDVINELSRQKDFSVIARQSSRHFGPDPAGAAEAAERLGVRYILAGSVMRFNERVRIGVQLIDAAGQRCVWAERYDRTLSDIFAVQDDIVGQIVGTIDAAVRLAERENAVRKPPANLDAWGLFHRGLWHAFNFSAEDSETAADYFQKAIAASPDFALPHAGRAYVCLLRIVWDMEGNPAALLTEGLDHARRAVALDGTSAFSLVVLGRLLTVAGKLDLALDHLTLARDLNPSFAQAYFGLGQALLWAGRPAEALPNVERALRLSPRDPLASMFLTLGSFCHFYMDDHGAAEDYARRAIALQTRENWSRIALAATLTETGRVEEARDLMRRARAANPALSMRSIDAIVHHAPQDIRERVYAGLRLAGLE
jgi:TolB-like protein/DNA-binding SARP family transcriptional activator